MTFSALQTQHLQRCIKTLALSFERLQAAEPESDDYDIYRQAVIKGFELVLELCGKLLRKALKTYVDIPKQTDTLPYKDVFRMACKHGLIHVAEAERWFLYRDNRNSTAHDYGALLAEETLALLPSFLQDARLLAQRIER